MTEQPRKYFRPDDRLINEARRTIANKRTNPYKEQLVALSKRSRITKVSGLMEILNTHHHNSLIHSFEDTFLAINLAYGMFGEPNQDNLPAYIEIFEDALLHDIGKIGVPQKLLNAEDRSTMGFEDRQKIRMHGVYGGAILNMVGLKSRSYISYEHDLASGTEKTWRGIIDLDSRHELTEIISLADLIGGLMDPRRPYRRPVEMDYLSWVVDVKGKQEVFSQKLVQAFRERILAFDLHPPFAMESYKSNEMFMALIGKYGLNNLFETAIREDQLTRKR